jgi:transposase
MLTSSPPDQARPLNATQAAAVAGVSTPTVCRWLRGYRGIRLAAQRIGGGPFRIDPADLAAFVAARQQLLAAISERVALRRR